MQQHFYHLADAATGFLHKDEVFTAYLTGEESDFCRFNTGRVRQAGSVKQSQLTLRLINGQRNAEGRLALSGIGSEDQSRIKHLLGVLRGQLEQLPEDPHLLYATEVHSSDRRRASELPASADVVAAVVDQAKGLDFVGIYAAGSLYRGFANSLGQRNWYETASFNLDWSLYLRADKAVKTGYAGFAWREPEFKLKLAEAKAQLAVLERPARALKPGRYRAYLAPAALGEVTDMLTWGGFSLKAMKTKQTPLLKMSEAGATMHAAVSMVEDTAGGTSPDFNEAGYTKPAQVTLINQGRYQDHLISARSAKEYGVLTNGASASEGPEALAMAPGKLPREAVLKTLEDGVYLNNLWYLNFSDRPACRVTGMTRFASFWVEKGEIVQPLAVMRFDESVLQMLGEQLVGLTAEREFIPSASTYGQRSMASVHLPGALIDEFTFTL